VFGYDLNSRIIPNTIRSCLSGVSPIIYKNVKDLRQYIHVMDLLHAFRVIIKLKRFGITNVATHDILNQEQVVETILKSFPEIKPIYTDPPIRKEISEQFMTPNWTPVGTFEGRIKETIEAFKNYGF